MKYQNTQTQMQMNAAYRAAKQAAWNKAAAGYAVSTAKPVYAHPVFGYGSK